MVCGAVSHVLGSPHLDSVPLRTHHAGLEGTVKVRSRDLIEETLRMRPMRAIVNEVRAEECVDLARTSTRSWCARPRLLTMSAVI